MSSPFDSIAARTGTDDVVHAIVEIPKGRRCKFELDHETGLIRLDRVLPGPLGYPGDYGFVPGTLAPDGDPLDVLILVQEPTFSGCLVRARLLGIFQMSDAGARDDKLLAVPETDPYFARCRTLDDVGPDELDAIALFFERYKGRQKQTVEVRGWASLEVARSECGECIERAAQSGRGPKPGAR